MTENNNPEQEKKRTIYVELSNSQVSQIVRSATGKSGVAVLGQIDVLRHDVAAALRDLQGIESRKVSHSLLKALSVLCAFSTDGCPKGVVELANETKMSPSTTHRYVETLVMVNLLERSPSTRKYRLSSW
jgi:IclR helix-turn-helix domain